jgi:hypothetical protein
MTGGGGNIVGRPGPPGVGAFKGGVVALVSPDCDPAAPARAGDAAAGLTGGKLSMG